MNERSVRLGIFTLLAAALMLPGTRADAGNFSGDEFVNAGGYLVVGGTNGFEQFRKDVGVDFDNTMGFEVRGGYRFMPNLAAEISGEFISGFETRIINDGTNAAIPPTAIPTFDLTIDGGNVTANVLAYLPFGRIQPYGMLGLGGMWSDLRTTYSVATYCRPGGYYYGWGWYCTGAYARLANSGGFVMKFGGGTDIYLTEDFALTVDASYVMPFGDIKELKYVNLSWGVRFNF
jgi:hypothetical protein